MRYASVKSGLVGAVALAALVATPAAAREARTKAPAAASSQVAKAATSKPKASASKSTAARTRAVKPTAVKPTPVAAAPIVALAAPTVVSYTPINQAALNLTGSSNFGATLAGDPNSPFTVTFDFLVTEAMLASSSITTQFSALNDIDFTSIFLDGFAFTQSGFDPADETFFLSLAGPLAAGTHVITVNGVTGSSGNGAFGGNLNLSPAAAVPEPGTWMLMLLGFGAIGVSVRKRRKPALAQLA